MAPTGADGGSPPTDADLRALTDDQRRQAAAEERRREHWLRRQAAEDGTFAGVLTDLAERTVPVALQTAAGRTVLGTLSRLGADFVGVRAPAGELVLVPVARVAAVRAEPDAATTVGDRTVSSDATLDLVLADLAVGRPRLSVHLEGGGQVAGELTGVGRDLLVLRGDTGTVTYVRMDALNDVTVP